MSKVSYRHTMKYYSTLKTKLILTHAITSVNLEGIMPYEISHKNTNSTVYDSNTISWRQKVVGWLPGAIGTWRGTRKEFLVNWHGWLLRFTR